ncbi:hypothetical protein LIER_23152 [Lithospermum erythrorhizon]|uniref:Uncharacterized protein n=1 Tax=Lithospermum erythrorhizon TaxID=34254 RepID=A0AAV3QXX3_LITER
MLGVMNFDKEVHVPFIERYGRNERGTDHYLNLLLKKKDLFTIAPGLELASVPSEPGSNSSFDYDWAPEH